MNNLLADEQFTAYPRQNDFMIGRPENDRHPLDSVSNDDLRAALARSPLSERAVSDAIGLKGKYRDLLLAIVEADSRGDAKMVDIFADTLAVGMGHTDPRRRENDPACSEGGLPAHAKRSWYNG